MNCSFVRMKLFDKSQRLVLSRRLLYKQQRMATEDINSPVPQNTPNGLEDELEVIEKAFINYEEPRSPKTLSLLCKRLLFQEYINAKPQNLCNGCRTKKGCMFRSLFAFLLSKSNPPVTKEECKQIIEDFAKNFNADLLQIIKGVKPNGKNLSIKDERKQLWRLWKEKSAHAQKFNIDVSLNGAESTPKKATSKKKKRKDSDGESPSNDSMVSMSLSSPAIWNQDDILHTHHTQHNNTNMHMNMNPNTSSNISTLMETVSLLSGSENPSHTDNDIIVQQGHIDNSNNNNMNSSTHQIMIPSKFKVLNKPKKKRKTSSGNNDNGHLESEEEGETEESDSDEDVTVDALSRKVEMVQQTIASNNQQIVAIVGTLNLMFHTLVQNNNQLQEEVIKLNKKIKKLKK